MENAKLSPKATAFAGALLCGSGVFLVALVNRFHQGYGADFLQMLDSIYPGYQAVPALRQVVFGTGYALVDGAIAGFLFAVLYNFCACCKSCKKDNSTE